MLIIKMKRSFKTFYGTIVTFVLISGSVFFCLALIFRKVIVSWFFEGIPFYPIVFIALLSLIFVSLHTMHQSILEGMQKGRKLTILNIIVIVFTIILKLFFIGILRLGAVGVLIAQLIVNICYFFYMFIDLRKNNYFILCIDSKILREALKYSIPLMPHNLSTRIASLASRIFINNAATLALVGLYSVSMQFSVLIDTIQSAVNKAFQPWFFDAMNNDNTNSKKEAVNLSKILLILYSLVYMVIGLFSQEIIIVMTNERYLMAWTVIPILVMAFSVKSIYYFYINILFYNKKASRKIFISTITGSLADIFLAYLLIPIYDMYGAALAFLLAKIIVVSIVIFLSRNYNDVGYNVMDMINIILPSLLFMGGGLYFSYTKYMTVFSWKNLSYKIIVLLVYLLFIYLSNRKMITRIIKSGMINKVFRIKRRKK